jgi:glutamyl/glutaminyl-tRNA synthetase
MDVLVGPCADEVAAGGDPPIRDRHGGWTYGFAVVVDDRRHGIDLVVRGRDLAAATPAQIRLGRLLGRERPPLFVHHPLIRRPDGRKLSKADGDTSVRDLRRAGRSPAELIGEAAAAIGLIDGARPIRVEEIGSWFLSGRG